MSGLDRELRLDLNVQIKLVSKNRGQHVIYPTNVMQAQYSAESYSTSAEYFDERL